MALRAHKDRKDNEYPAVSGDKSSMSRVDVPALPLYSIQGQVNLANVERSFAWTARFHRPVRDYGRLAKTLAAFHFRVFACVMLTNLFRLPAGSQQLPLTETESGNSYIA